MNDLSDTKKIAERDSRVAPAHKVRFVTAASLFDGHDASINIMRRILQSNGCEVIHLGHNRSVDEIVTCALQEDVQGIAMSSYQGGHVEFFKYMIDLLRERGGEHIKVFARRRRRDRRRGDRASCMAYGVDAHLLPRGRAADGAAGDDQRHDRALRRRPVDARRRRRSTGVAARRPPPARAADHRAREPSRPTGAVGDASRRCATRCYRAADEATVPMLGITGTGGAGKSSLTDELIRRFRLDQDDALTIAVISIDPSRRKSGGALLGDRIRMNAIGPGSGRTAARASVYMRSLATREAGQEISRRAAAT